MSKTIKCQACRDGKAFEFPFTMAFQPILDVEKGSVFAYEALLRGTDGAGAGALLSRVNADNRYAFDQACRVKAIELASELDLANGGAVLSINFLPNAVYEPRACIRLTLEAAARTGFPVDQIMFEFTEQERLDPAHVLNILRTYRDLGFTTAIDDFGAGYAGLSLLTQFQPDIIKLDMALIRDIDQSAVKRSMVRHIVNLAADLGIRVVCEGVETVAEYQVLSDMSVALMQGYLFARPEIEALPLPVRPGSEMTQTA